jgi:hypothetical protein
MTILLLEGAGVRRAIAVFKLLLIEVGKTSAVGCWVARTKYIRTALPSAMRRISFSLSSQPENSSTIVTNVGKSEPLSASGARFRQRGLVSLSWLPGVSLVTRLVGTRLESNR